MQLPLRYILTVTELTQEIKETLEGKFYDVWVEGEISNLRIPPSGHLYFTLKDDFSQIRAVLFRMRSKTIRFLPEDGLHVICRGRVSIYERRGEYQLILEEMEPKGIGALQLAFLQLKERLEKEGLFDPTHKKPLPILPQTIGIITSPTGAVIKDMIHIIHRRFENVSILLYPVRVQGEGASREIVDGIQYFNKMKNVDVIIIGRGGGSLEDLWAFNEEEVARAIYHSKIPIISAVGHETDYTISDFVADLRAPTPSAAAELVVKDKWELKRNIHYLEDRLQNQILQSLQDLRKSVSHLRKRLIHPKKRIENLFLRLDELTHRIERSILKEMKIKKEKTVFLMERVFIQNPIQRMKMLRISINEIQRGLIQRIKGIIELKRSRLNGMIGKLESLSPLSVLQRGYSITRKLPSLQILRDSNQVKKGDQVEVRLARGNLVCNVEKTEGS
ncbi:MAG: exodeoxyribonuclease VII large subunit [Thermodesulfobacteriota bacterium]